MIDVFCQTQMAVAPGKLEVQILEAKNLIAADSGGTSDPYCKIHVGATNFKTKVIKKNLNPKWNEKFNFTVANPKTAKVVIEVYDKDAFSKDDPLGQISLPLTKLEKGVPLKEWYNLSGVPHGQIFVQLLAIDFGLAPGTSPHQSGLPPQGAPGQFPPQAGFPPGQPGYQSGYPAQPGYPPQGYPPQQPYGSQAPAGYPPQPGYPPQGYPPQQPYGSQAPPGYPPQGYPPQPGYPPQGYPPQPYGSQAPGGYPPQGYPPQPGYPPQGYPPQQPYGSQAPGGYPPQGYPPQAGYPPQGGQPPAGGAPPR